MWTLYAQWRYRGVSPRVAFLGPGAARSLFPEREEAILVAFAEHAALQEGAARDAIEAFAASQKGAD